MDSFELNKVLGALLGTIFVVFSVSLIADAIFAPHPPATQGFAIEVSEEVAGGPAEDVPSGPSALELIPTADAAAGESAFRRCTACHTAEEGGANRVGPNLWDIVNRPVAAVPGFAYSAGMQAFAEGGTVWDYEHLSGFLVNPRGYVPGTTMSFAGIRDPQEEANLIAYMRTLSNDPAPLPEVAPAEPETAAQPAQPTPETDGTEVGPEPDAGTPAVPQADQTQEAPAGELSPEDAAPVDAAPEQAPAPAGDQQGAAPAQAPVEEQAAAPAENQTEAAAPAADAPPVLLPEGQQPEGQQAAQAQPAPAAGAAPVAEAQGSEALTMLASADPAAGEAFFRRCAACHTTEQGGANRVGPNLWDIVNRPVAAVEGFNYSEAMLEFAQGGTVWDFPNLSAYLVDPRGFIPGNRMAYPGIPNPQDEANLLAYLNTLSENPAPLP